jgi:predicted AAA+ superfamily ATPase
MDTADETRHARQVRAYYDHNTERFLMIGALLVNGKKPAQVLRVNLEEPLFAAEYSIDLLEQIYRLYREKIHPSGRCYLFLDEIQNIPEWERWVHGRGETENLKIVSTGSSSRLLSREVGAKLTGRHVSFELFPLSFAEFLRFKGLQVGSNEAYFEQKPIIRSLFAEYRKYGGFPENIVLNHLRSRHEEIYYESNGGEVDFVVKEGMKITRSIQVWHADAASTAIPEKEFAAFKIKDRAAAKREYFLITNDVARTVRAGGTQIQCVPLVLFLLDLL